MLQFILRRLGGLIFVLVGVSVLTFFLAQIVPIDPAATALGSNAREEQIEAYRKEMGLDQPAVIQYVSLCSAASCRATWASRFAHAAP